MSAPLDDYTALKTYGHSAAKAAEIILDAKRGDFFCQRYITFVRGSVAETPNDGSIPSDD